MGQVVAFPGPLEGSGDDGRWTCEAFHRFMGTGPWRERQELLLPRHKVTMFDYGGGWSWRVEFLPTKEILWGKGYPTLFAAKRGCWGAKWPGEGK
jgi:hypothetical protein